MPRSENVDFNEQGFAAVQRDIRDLFLLAEDGSRDLNQDASAANQATADDGLSSLGTMAQQDANAVAITGGTLNGVTLGSNVTLPSNVSFVTYATGAGALLAAGAWTQVTAGWALSAGSLTGFNTGTGLFTPPATGVYAFVFAFTGTPAAYASVLALGMFGGYAQANAPHITNVADGGSYAIFPTVYATTSQNLGFYWGTSVNWTGAHFDLLISRVA